MFLDRPTELSLVPLTFLGVVKVFCLAFFVKLIATNLIKFFWYRAKGSHYTANTYLIFLAGLVCHKTTFEMFGLYFYNYMPPTVCFQMVRVVLTCAGFALYYWSGERFFSIKRPGVKRGLFNN